MRAPLSRVDAVLATLRRGQRQLARDPRGAIETAVQQLLALGRTAAESRGREEPARSYRIDDLARVSGTTVRNVRAYLERGLLHPARRDGRVSVFDDTHLSRLKIIMSMLDRGYTSAHILEMLTAWEDGKDLADVLGLENALVQPQVDDPPATMGLAAARELAGGAEDLELLVGAGLVERSGARARVLRPKLLAAFAEMRAYGMTTATLLDVHQRVEPAVDQISEILVSAGAAHLAPRFVSPEPPTSADVAELVTMLTRFRALAMASVTATLTVSIERTIEGLLSEYLAHYVRTTRPADAS